MLVGLVVKQSVIEGEIFRCDQSRYVIMLKKIDVMRYVYSGDSHIHTVNRRNPLSVIINSGKYVHTHAVCTFNIRVLTYTEIVGWNS